MKKGWNINNYETKLLKEQLFDKINKLNLNFEKEKNSDINSDFNVDIIMKIIKWLIVNFLVFNISNQNFTFIFEYTFISQKFYFTRISRKIFIFKLILSIY